MKQYELGKQLYREWAKEVIGLGGSISAEHGVGKLKAGLLKEMYGLDGIEQMRSVKKLFDPDWIMNPGNLFEADEQ